MGGPHRKLRILEGVDHLLEEAIEGLALALPLTEVDVGKLPCHPTGLGPQVAVGAVKTRHHIVQQQPLQMVLIGSLQE